MIFWLMTLPTEQLTAVGCDVFFILVYDSKCVFEFLFDFVFVFLFGFDVSSLK